jgi:hypothetical protein
MSVLFLAGCANVNGPFAYRPPERVDDPRFTIAEQEARGRDRLSQPDPSPYVAPPIVPVFPRPSPSGS